MSDKVVNLNKFRKRKAREAAHEQAAQNRVAFGRTREQKQLDEAEKAAAEERMRQLRRDPQPPEDA